MARKPTSLIPRTHRELCEIAEHWLMGSARCRVAIAEPNCIVTNEQPDAIGFKGSYSILVEAKTSRADFWQTSKSRSAFILKMAWGFTAITSANRESSRKMIYRNGGDYCMSSLADGFG